MTQLFLDNLLYQMITMCQVLSYPNILEMRERNMVFNDWYLNWKVFFNYNLNNSSLI